MSIDIQATFEKYGDKEYIKFDRVQTKLSTRPDLHAFILLDRLAPPAKDGRDIVMGAEHDEIWLDTDITALADAATEADIIDLIRCGVRYDSDNDSLCMFA